MRGITERFASGNCRVLADLDCVILSFAAELPKMIETARKHVTDAKMTGATSAFFRFPYKKHELQCRLGYHLSDTAQEEQLIATISSF